MSCSGGSGRPACRGVRGACGRRLALVRGRAHVRQRRLPHALIVGGAALGREDLTETGLDALRWLGDESGLVEGTLRLTGHRGRQRTEPAPGGGRRAAARRLRLRRGGAGRVRRHGRSGARYARAAVHSTGSSAATGSTGRCTTSRPAAAAMGSARRRRTTTRAPSRRSRSTARRSCSTRPDCRPSCAIGPASPPQRDPARALPAPRRQPDPDGGGLAVSRQRRLQPGRGAARRHDGAPRASRRT